MLQQRREEILAKKAKLAELKRQRELRSRESSIGKQSVGNSGDPTALSSNRADNREELDKYISSILVAGERKRPSSSGPGIGSQAGKDSRPNSVLSAGELSIENFEPSSSSSGPTELSLPPKLSTAPLETVYEFPPSPVKETFSYSKAVQTTEPWSPKPSRSEIFDDFDSDDTDNPVISNSNKRFSRRDKNRDAELREKIKLEIEEELKAARDLANDDSSQNISSSTPKFPSRSLTTDELQAVTSSEEFMEFVDRSTKIIERALDQKYDILSDYSRMGTNDKNEFDDEYGNARGNGRRRVKEIAQFYDQRWSKKRMISDINFSTKFPELLLAAYTKNPSAPHDPDGLVQIWNAHLIDSPEYVFHAQSDVLTAKFSHFHPNLIVGGCYSGQVLLWDTRAKSSPVQKTPLTGSGHTHPVYSVDIVGTQNANNIISCSTDGVVCSWTVDMLAQPQELLTLITPPPSKNEDLAPTCMAFPKTDPTYFLVGSEEGAIFPCHRYDRAGAKAGVDQRISYRGHAAPVMSIDFHPARGPIDLGDLFLSSSLDWSIRLWKVRAPAATSSTAVTGQGQAVTPILNITREDIVYDAAWSPVKPGVFSVVDGAGNLEIWDITVDTEVPQAKVAPNIRKDGRSMLSKSLHKTSWEVTEGRRVATGGIDGCVTVFEVGPDLGGKESAHNEEWTIVKKLVTRLECADSTSINDID